jgi:hypothetical protein
VWVLRIIRTSKRHAGNAEVVTPSKARALAGYGQGPWGEGPYGQSYLLIDHGDDKPESERYQTAEQLMDEALAFWRGFFDANRPENA